MKQTFLFIAMFFIAILGLSAQSTPVWDGTIATAYGGGTGKKADPYIINNSQELAFLAQKANEPTDYTEVYFKLMSNIDLNNLAWTPIANKDYADSFKGYFDGNNKTIANLNVDTGKEYNGLFGAVHAIATIKGIGIVSGTVTVNSGDDIALYAGGIAGLSNGTIENCYNLCTVVGTSTSTGSNSYVYAGGVIGQSYGTVKNCFNTANISAKTNSVSMGQSCAGGVIGMSYGNASNCYNKGNISSDPWFAGGIVGMNNGSAITNSYNTGTLTSAWSQVGGISATGTCSNSYYLENSSTNANGATVKSETEMKEARFVTTLNGGQSPAIWITDHENNVNDGLPILYYQPANTSTPTWDGTIATAYGGGTGKKADPYIISTPQELAFLAQKANEPTDYEGVYFKLMSNIDLNNLAWTPIANKDYADSFKGYFDGNNKTIANLNVNTGKAYNGLFGTVHAIATIKGLGIISGTVTANSGDDITLYAGGIAGLSNGTIENCYNWSTVTGTSTSEGANGSVYAGGVIGQSYGTVKNCFNQANISAKIHDNNWTAQCCAGGIIGLSYGTTSDCYNVGDISSQPSFAGGIVGMNNGLAITNSYNTGKISSSWSLTGGISGNGTCSNSYYLEGSTTNANGATVKTETEMKDAAFIEALNAGQMPALWLADYTPSINNGFPILYYQTAGGDEPSGVVITIADNEHGTLKVLKDGIEITSGDKIEPGSRLKLVAVPNDNYVLDAFMADGAKIFGYDYDVFTAVEFSVSFEYSKDVVRWDGTVATTYGGGTGTKTDPFLIYTPQELALIGKKTTDGDYDMNTYFKLMNNLDLSMFDWTPIGPSNDNSFRAHFDGNYKTIANLYINNNTLKYVGLFGYLNPIEVKNLGIIGNSCISSTSQYSYVGMIAGESHGTILNCYSEGDIMVSNNSYAGGLIGRTNGTIANCYNHGNVAVSTYSHAGGIAYENNKKIENCYVTGKITALANSIAGAVSAYNSGTISNSYYLTGSCTDAGSGIEKTEEEMKASDFVTLLNNNQYNTPWIADQTPNINHGFPILKWEAGAIFAIEIIQPENGTIKVFNDGVELNSGDKVIWETILTFKATPVEEYIIKTFVFDNAPIFGEKYQTYDNATITAEFEQIEGIIRWDGTIATDYSGGRGTEKDPFLIGTPQELAYLAQELNGGAKYEGFYFKLMNNLDLCHIDWTPIGINAVVAMTGAFDGNGKVIANLRVNAVMSGLFGSISTVAKEIKNLGIVGVNIISNPGVLAEGEFPYVGVIAGQNYAIMSNCYAKGGSITSTQNAGGLVGINQGTINNCFTHNGVESGLYVGGVAGNNYGIISNTYCTGTVFSEFLHQNYKGGITAYNDKKASVKNSYYVDGTDVGGGVQKSATDMKTVEFATLLNKNQAKSAWSTDLTPNINNGFPILKWQDPRKFIITVTQTENGVIAPETTTATFGDNVTFTIAANKNYHIVDVLVDNVSVGVVEEYIFNNITENHTITATFAINPYTITVTQSENGTIDPATIMVNHGGNQTFTITPSTNFQIKEVIVDGVNIGVVSSYTFTNVKDDHTITALFEPLVGVNDAIELSAKIYSYGKIINVESEDVIDAVINIFDISGKTVKSEPINGISAQIMIPNPGIYIVRINTNNTTIKTQKVIIK